MRRWILGVVLATAPAFAEGPVSPAPTPVLDGFRVVGSFETDVREISGAVVLPGGTDGEGTLLVVCDEGRHLPERGLIEGSLHRIPYRILDDGRIEAGASRPVPIRTHGRIPAPAAAPPQGTPGVDMEGISRLPGTEDLYVVSGERDPGPSNGPANRAYLVRHPPDGSGAADLLACFELPDLPLDGENDRFEGVAVSRPTAGGDGAKGPDGRSWRVWFFKERTTPPGSVPSVLPATLSQRGDEFRLEAPAASKAFRLATRASVLSTQSDACAAADGTVWVLDRWRRQVHLAREAGEGLEIRSTVDLWEVLKDVPGETFPIGGPPPGLEARTGFGLHEAIAFDAAGRLFLAADRTERFPSVVTVLAPRPKSD